MIDTHCHLYLEEFDEDRDEQVRIAKDSGIEMILTPNVDLETIGSMHDLCDKYPDFAIPMMGLHPTNVDANYAETLRQIEAKLPTRPYCAIGEIGMDLYWDKAFVKEQKLVFEEQLRWSIDLDLPVVIHTRDAFDETFEVVHRVGADRLRGVFHSFGGTLAELEEIKRMENFYIGINGVATFKKVTLDQILPDFPIERVLLETDAPYLAPVPYRGKRNIPIYIWKTAEKLATIYGVSLEEIRGITRTNAIELFKLKGFF